MAIDSRVKCFANWFATRFEDDSHHLVVDLDDLPGKHLDAFSRVRVSEPGYRFDSQFTYRIDSDLWDVVETGDGSVDHDATNRLATLTAGNTAGANTAILQSHYHAPYTPGRGQLAFITFSFPDDVPTNGEVGVGYYDGSDGVYLKKTASAVTLNIANTTGADAESVEQADWNIDPMDGTGPSGITLDLKKTQILAIQMQALYVGQTIVGFDLNGELFPVHAFNHANISTLPYLAQASLPVRYWANTSTDSGSAVVKAICATVISDGGPDLFKMPGRPFVATGSLANTAAGAVIVVRCKQQLNSINQNVICLPTIVDVTVADAGCWVEIRRNATITAGTFEDVDAASVMEVSFAGNAGTDPAVTGGTGTLIDRFYVNASATTRTAKETGLSGKIVLDYSHLLGVGDTLSVIYNGGTASTDVFASLDWIEIR